jgi:L-lactate dehydrogenase
MGIGMVAARIAEAMLRDEKAAFPIGVYNPKFDVALSMPTIVGIGGAVRILDPEMSESERQALWQSAGRLHQVAASLKVWQAYPAAARATSLRARCKS